MKNYITVNDKDTGKHIINMDMVESFRKVADACIEFKFVNRSIEIEYLTDKARDKAFDRLMTFFSHTIH